MKLQNLENTTECQTLLVDAVSLLTTNISLPSEKKTLINRVLERSTQLWGNADNYEHCLADTAQAELMSTAMCTIAGVLGWAVRIAADAVSPDLSTWSPSAVWVVIPPVLAVVLVVNACFSLMVISIKVFHVLIGIVAFIHCAGICRSRQSLESDLNTKPQDKSNVGGISLAWAVVLILAVGFGLSFQFSGTTTR